MLLTSTHQRTKCSQKWGIWRDGVDFASAMELLVFWHLCTRPHRLPESLSNSSVDSIISSFVYGRLPPNIPSLHNELLANQRISTNHTALLEIRCHDKFGRPCHESFEGRGGRLLTGDGERDWLEKDWKQEKRDRKRGRGFPLLLPPRVFQAAWREGNLDMKFSNGALPSELVARHVRISDLQSTATPRQSDSPS